MEASRALPGVGEGMGLGVPWRWAPAYMCAGLVVLPLALAGRVTHWKGKEAQWGAG